jgi:hypothetical protein
LRSRKRKAGVLDGLRAAGKEKERGREGQLGQKERREEGSGERGFLFLKFFSNSFFKHSNFTQTRNHAFES